MSETGDRNTERWRQERWMKQETQDEESLEKRWMDGLMEGVTVGGKRS